MHLRWRYSWRRVRCAALAEASRPCTCVSIIQHLAFCGLLALHRPSRTRAALRLSSRVACPGLRARLLTWVLPAEVPVKSAAIELWAWSELVELQRSISAGCFESVAWPRRLHTLAIYNGLVTVPVTAARWPPGLQRLTLGGGFNQPIVGVVWPAPL